MVRLLLEETIEWYIRMSQIGHLFAEKNELWTGRFKIKWEKNYESLKGTLFFIGIYPQGYMRLDLFKLMVMVVILIVFH